MRLILALATGLVASAATADVVTAPGGVLRIQDKMTGVVADQDMAAGQSHALGRLTVTLDACRYPADLPMGEAFAHVTITDSGAPLFKGWMIASSPALSALDHPRYDVWILHCDVPAAG
jgi:hypothetical protein